MSHIFISYARKDIDFVQEIVEVFRSYGDEVWIDLDDIPKGEEWEDEIYRGIDEAETFLFMLSPDSVESDMCKKEISHATASGKRIIPIVIRDTDRKLIPEEIAKRNWIFCRYGQENLTDAIAETRETIQTDFKWAKFHTQLLNKALEWERTQDTSRLLRGKELREAEGVLAGISSKKEPQPTDLQRNFLLQSQKGEKRQHRRNTIIFFVLILLCLGVGVASYYFFDRTPAAVNIEGQVFEIRNRSNYRFLRIDVGSTISVYADPIKMTSIGAPLIIVGTDGDGTRPGTVLAYDMSGKIKWEYGANSDPYGGPTANFKVRRILVDKILDDGEYQIVFTTQKSDWYPSELVLLNAKGEILGSYWNSGFIYDVLPQDLDDDGIKELVISAVNNNLGYLIVNDETKHPAIIYILSPKDDFTGQTFPPLIDGRPSGTEFNNWTAVLEPFEVGRAQLRIVRENNQEMIEIVTDPLGGYIYLDQFGEIQRVGISDFWRSERGDQSPADYICFLRRETDGWYISARTDQILLCPWYTGQ